MAMWTHPSLLFGAIFGEFDIDSGVDKTGIDAAITYPTEVPRLWQV